MPSTMTRDRRYAAAAAAGTIEKAHTLKVGDRVWLDVEKRPYTVRARSDRFIVLTKPFNLQHTVLYTVADLEFGIIGRDDWYGLGYETDEQCEAALAKFESGDAEISVRANATLFIARAVPA